MFFYRSSFSDFAQKYAKDERFKNVEKMREREGLFNEYLIEVRKREKEEKSHRREQVGQFLKVSVPRNFGHPRYVYLLKNIFPLLQ